MAENRDSANRFGWLAALWLGVLYSPLVPFNAFLGFWLGDKRRFLPLDEYPELLRLTESFSLIRDELVALQEGGTRIPGFAEIDPGQIRLAGDGQWKTFLFKIFGVEVPRNLALCPETAGLLDQVPRITMAMFSILEPGKTLPLHTGAYRGVLRYILPLISTEPDRCAITVGGETHAFEEGVPLLFDDVFPHTAWNLGERPRVVLFIDVERKMPSPWLTHLNRFCLGLLGRAKRMKRAAGRAVID
ncbi:MAG: aspartyl/asparaginyl beta-hydroxylase domain-containing protein [Myxococcota bacterium]|nr:aspartyl/asparaginyl beta-hydroxylase domain-containing protein [Myxococcota bacterium]